jgi:uncharacterized protein (TIGR00730 family)
VLRRLAIFLGSREGSDPRLGNAAYAVGQRLAEREIELVYGGGGAGLMGRLSQGVLDHGGHIHGVIPRFMVEREWARMRQPGVELHVVETMHERKARMTERAEAFLVLPGGLGTLEEFFEVWTWLTLGLHHKPIGLLDVDGFFGPLVAMLERTVESDFVDRRTLDELVVASDIDTALERLSART